MEFEISWIESSLVSVRTSGLASAEGFTALYEQLAAQPGFGPGVKMLSDHTDLDVSVLSVAEIEKIAAARDRYVGSLGARSALVVGHRSPAKYGLARMFEALAAEEPGDLVGVVETSEDALVWLRGEDAKPLPPAWRRAEP
jgi:hypothetical protein